MLARWMRTWDARFLRPCVMLMAHHGVRPGMVTLASLALSVISGFTLSQGYLALGACLLLTGGLLDAIDGELARFLKCESQMGGFVDSVSDHCGDFSIYMGLLFFSMERGMTINILLIFIASFGSLFASHVRSRAAMAGVDTRDVGVFTRCERILALALGLLTMRVTIALAVLAIFNNFSAAQRLIYVAHAAHRSQT